VRPSWQTTITNQGILSYINHTDTTAAAPVRLCGMVSAAFGALGATVTVPSGSLAFIGHHAIAGQAKDAATYGGKIVAAYSAAFTKTGTNYAQSVIDQQNTTLCTFGNFDHISLYWGNFNAYTGIILPTAGKAGISSTVRAVIQGIASTTQCAIYGEALAYTNAANNACTESYWARIPFPANTSATNTAHLAFVTKASASGGPVWVTNGGVYFDTGTNNALGLYEHDGTAWRKLLTPETLSVVFYDDEIISYDDDIVRY